jgi:hypothetical protein
MHKVLLQEHQDKHEEHMKQAQREHEERMSHDKQRIKEQLTHIKEQETQRKASLDSLQVNSRKASGSPGGVPGGVWRCLRYLVT